MWQPAGQLTVEAIRGRCLCGQVCYEVTEPVRRLYQCHCSLCRKQGSAASNSATIVNAAAFRWTAGRTGVKSFAKASGFTSNFCANCGSTVPNQLRTSAYVWVPFGAIENPPRVSIAVHLYTHSKAGWDTMSPGGAEFGTMPTVEELVSLLHEGTRGRGAR